MRKIIAIVALILILAGVNWSIYQKEQHLATGAIAYLKLRPVDPRSLMQGDYMRLRFELADKIIAALPKKPIGSSNWRNRHNVDASDGYVVVTLDDKRVASFKSIYTEGVTLADNEIKLQYRVRNSRVKFATNAFFFQEGTAKVYEAAKFGQFRVNNHGGLLLATMFDKDLKKLEANTK